MNALDKSVFWPDYARSGVSLIGSIAAFLGLDAPYGSIQPLDTVLRQRKPRNIILLLLDGLGYTTLVETLPANSFLRSHLSLELSSVYPSTTVAATASLRSGLPPVSHGRLGWTMYFPQIDRSVDVFSNNAQYQNSQAAGFHVADSYLPYPDLNGRLSRQTTVTATSVSAFDDIKAETFDDLTAQILKACDEPERHYLYTYYREPDFSMHQFGIHSRKTLQQIQKLDRDCEKLHEALPGDSLLMITADHGLVDAMPAVMEEYPQLGRMLLRPPVLEPRCAAFYVKPDCLDDFPPAFNDALGTDFLLLTVSEALDRQIFGPGRVMPGIQQYLGDYLAIATGQRSIFQKRKHCRMIGMHAGLTEREMRVPLIIPK